MKKQKDENNIECCYNCAKRNGTKCKVKIVINNPYTEWCRGYKRKKK